MSEEQKTTDPQTAILDAKDEIRKKKEKERQDSKKKAIEEYRKSLGVPFVDWSRDGYPKCTIKNVEALLEAAKINVRYNIIKKDLEIVIPNRQYLKDTEKEDKMNSLVSLAVTKDMPVGLFPSFVKTIASANPYNPVTTWILSKPWDGISRLDSFYATVTTGEEHTEKGKTFKETLLRKWFISAVAAAFSNRGIKAQGLLVFQGEQGLGKSTWFSKLTPKDLDIGKVEASMDPRNKDSVQQTINYWIVELGELDATFKRADIAALKAFVTSDTDEYRKAYDRAATVSPRRTVFMATVNREDFLVDSTGNRRFWVLPVKHLDIHFEIDMQQLWREVYDTLYLKGESFVLTREELAELNLNNEAFEVHDPMQEFVAKNYLKGGENDFVTPSDIARAYGILMPTVRDSMVIGRAVAKVFKLKKVRFLVEQTGQRIWGYNLVKASDDRVSEQPF